MYGRKQRFLSYANIIILLYLILHICFSSFSGKIDKVTQISTKDLFCLDLIENDTSNNVIVCRCIAESMVINTLRISEDIRREQLQKIRHFVMPGSDAISNEILEQPAAIADNSEHISPASEAGGLNDPITPCEEITWTCIYCTFQNRSLATRCKICLKLPPRSGRTKVDEQQCMPLKKRIRPDFKSKKKLFETNAPIAQTPPRCASLSKEQPINGKKRSRITPSRGKASTSKLGSSTKKNRSSASLCETEVNHQIQTEVGKFIDNAPEREFERKHSTINIANVP